MRIKGGEKLTDLRWLNLLLKNPYKMSIDGAGEVTADVNVASGWLAPGTVLELHPTALIVNVLEYAANGKGRVLCSEIMLPNAAIRALVREDKAHQIYSIIQVSGGVGMRTMNQSLYEQYRRGAITYDDALSHSSNPEDLKNMFKRAGSSTAKNNRR